MGFHKFTNAVQGAVKEKFRSRKHGQPAPKEPPSEVEMEARKIAWEKYYQEDRDARRTELRNEASKLQKKTDGCPPGLFALALQRFFEGYEKKNSAGSDYEDYEIEQSALGGYVTLDAETLLRRTSVLKVAILRVDVIGENDKDKLFDQFSRITDEYYRITRIYNDWDGMDTLVSPPCNVKGFSKFLERNHLTDKNTELSFYSALKRVQEEFEKLQCEPDQPAFDLDSYSSL